MSKAKIIPFLSKGPEFKLIPDQRLLPFLDNN